MEVHADRNKVCCGLDSDEKRSAWERGAEPTAAGADPKPKKLGPDEGSSALGAFKLLLACLCAEQSTYTVSTAQRRPVAQAHVPGSLASTQDRAGRARTLATCTVSDLGAAATACSMHGTCRTPATQAASPRTSAEPTGSPQACAGHAQATTSTRCGAGPRLVLADTLFPQALGRPGKVGLPCLVAPLHLCVCGLHLRDGQALKLLRRMLCGEPTATHGPAAALTSC